MLLPLCNSNHQFPSLSSQTLIKPSLQIQCRRRSVVQFKSLRRPTSISAAALAADTRVLPQSEIRRIAEKLRSLGYAEKSGGNRPESDESAATGRNSPGEIFVPLRTRLPIKRVGHTLDPSWSTPGNPVPEPGAGNAMQRFHELRRGVLAEEKEREKERIKKRREGKLEKVPTLAELTLPKEELARLTTIGIGLRKKLKVGKAGITEGIVNGIHERWRRSELVKITCEDICRLNMKRTHQLLERKTGGLVVWRSGSNIILYRGSNYKYPYFITDSLEDETSSEESPDMDNSQTTLSQAPLSATNAVECPGQDSDVRISDPKLVQGVGLPNRVRFQLPGELQIVEEADTLLEGLGPRFTDWWGNDPLPIDADLLPAVVPGYRRPFRLLPYGVKPKLTNDEMNTLRRLGRPLPCHFALGRNRRLQGLAASMVKLWEKSEIAKIAVKRGVQNTNSEMMAEELKRLTGGTLLARDREFIVFYRGKDFLPAAVSSAIEERRKYGMGMSETRTNNSKEHEHGNKDADTEEDEENDPNLTGHFGKRKLRFSEAAVERTNTKLSLALEKKARAEKLLARLKEEEKPQKPETDKEGITEEERYMLRKVGLRMKPFLLLGRRGVFDGTVENMHLHWKYRELVKICVGRGSYNEIHEIARTLEAESGGILVAIERVSKGFAIIVYRGKNYTRPASLRPRTLLSKREALKRSKEAQRRESLQLRVLKLSRDIDEMKLKMAKDEDANDTRSTEDQEHVIENEINEIDNNATHEDPEIDYESISEDSVAEAIECRSTDVASTEPEDFMHTPKDSLHIDRHYLFETTETEIRQQPLPKRPEGFLNLNRQSGNTKLLHPRRSQYQTRSSTTTYHQPESRGGDSHVHGRENSELEPPCAEKATDVKPPLMPLRATQLSNRERLILRKRALKMKKAPLLAVGKSNVVTGVAKAIKAHFEKHPLVVVNIKGRAKGTSAQEVIYNLEQATGAILVSQEPSKVVLYRGWDSGTEPEQEKAIKKVNNNDSDGVWAKPRPTVSPELISALRLEFDLENVDSEHVASDATLP
ncbi:CRM-domain containing factor CFM2, chloroplastic [Andrographis paniculata]|uniref:CRM-domain containing factor CFM2, chloroplastic n=1 Tax=Andrographis paniculata TaxID=175694 RepID=UPI0021E74DDF|nr:CRM-domain containing factor CFM2, chloroplastic [Andrographis paniculata]